MPPPRLSMTSPPLTHSSGENDCCLMRSPLSGAAYGHHPYCHSGQLLSNQLLPQESLDIATKPVSPSSIWLMSSCNSR